MMQNSSLQAFMDHLIDYAGLFPPAILPMKKAIRNYAAYRITNDAWMLGRFIIPASRLVELEDEMSLFSPEMPLALSVLGSKSDDPITCKGRLHVDLARIEGFRDKYGDAVEIGMFELPVLPFVPDCGLLAAIAGETSKRGLYTFCEVTLLHQNWEQQLLLTLDKIAEHNATGGPELGVKLRTGGVTADAFPTPIQVAWLLLGCRNRGINIKCTAGLHHPIRMYREEVRTKMHGFINLFAAGMLAHTHSLDVMTTTQILADEESTHFSFTNEGLSWRDYTVSTSEIEQLRATVLSSYGSCSFDEPREDLTTLKFL
ncbi:hypothetical protein [Brevibacillus porteri]|uniref:hypothetical protein n=1 Tax=Brevibacillus porteri TaxID=2126350 RepID=UPI003629F12B